MRKPSIAALAALASVVVLAAGAALSVLAPAAGAYSTGPPVGHTGGFGEPTCGVCHIGEEPGSALAVEAPAAYVPGRAYELVVTLQDPELRAGGFQLAARFAEGDLAGQQAGSLVPVDSTTLVLTSGAGVQYASHSELGTTPAKDGLARWQVRWTAPAAGGPVVFHASGNAANDDYSELGDRLHTTEARAIVANEKD